MVPAITQPHFCIKVFDRRLRPSFLKKTPYYRKIEEQENLR